MKNVLITGEAYEQLLLLGFTPEQLLAKLPKSEDRIKSPKSKKFIHIYTVAYRNLLKEYSEDELLLRRDGYIKSPENGKLLKVFGKKFNLLLDKYNINDLLKLPREKKGDKAIGVAFNNIVTLKQQCEQIKNKNLAIKSIKYDKKVEEEDVDKLIKNLNNVAVYIKAKLQDKYEFYGCGIFNNAKMVEYFDMKEYLDDFIYSNKVKVFDVVTSVNEYKDWLQEDNDRQLTNLTLDTIDLSSLIKILGYSDKKIKDELSFILTNTTYDPNSLLSVCKHHLWLSTNAKMVNILPPTYTHKSTFTLYDENLNDRNFDQFEEIKEHKLLLIDEIKSLKCKLLNYYK